MEPEGLLPRSQEPATGSSKTWLPDCSKCMKTEKFWTNCIHYYTPDTRNLVSVTSEMCICVKMECGERHFRKLSWSVAVNRQATSSRANCTAELLPLDPKESINADKKLLSHLSAFFTALRELHISSTSR
jgi:hypothetical protein